MVRHDHNHDTSQITRQRSMLQPIAFTNHRLNSSTLNYNSSTKVPSSDKSTPSNNKRKRVTFDKEALAASETHFLRPTRARSGTPLTELKKAEVPVIGSSCTWKQDELDFFRVKVERNVHVKNIMIPERFWDFGGLERYEKCRKELMAVKAEDIDNRSVINRIENRSNLVFVSLFELLQKQSDLRALNMAKKLSKKSTSGRNQSLELDSSTSSQASIDPFSQPKIDNRFPPSSMTLPKIAETKTTTFGTTSTPSAITTTVKSTRRIVSDASIADPEQDSAGGIRVLASNEKASDRFANNLIDHITSSIWPDGIILDWVQGREGDTQLVWSSKDARAILTMANQKVQAKTDGSLQIQIPDKHSPGGSIPWNRQYYALPLEAKRFSREGKGKEKKEITDSKHSVFAGQILAEMLAGICHKEFYKQRDQEMFTIFITHTSFQLYHCVFPQKYLESIHNPSPPIISSSDQSTAPPAATTTAANDTAPSTQEPLLESIPMDHPVIPTQVGPQQDVTLRSTRLYNFCDVQDRGEWFDILVALIMYLRSGESRVGYLNRFMEMNMLHKDIEEQAETDIVAESAVDGVVVERPAVEEMVVTGDTGMGVVVDDGVTGLRRSTRKRRVDDSADKEKEKEERNTKVRKVARRKM